VGEAVGTVVRRTPATKARVKPPKKSASPAPLTKAFAVVATRLIGEYATRAEAEMRAEQYHVSVAKRDEWTVVLSNGKKEKKR
jgi:hypothetical protein